MPSAFRKRLPVNFREAYAKVSAGEEPIKFPLDAETVDELGFVYPDDLPELSGRQKRRVKKWVAKAGDEGQPEFDAAVAALVAMVPGVAPEMLPLLKTTDEFEYGVWVRPQNPSMQLIPVVEDSGALQFPGQARFCTLHDLESATRDGALNLSKGHMETMIEEKCKGPPADAVLVTEFVREEMALAIPGAERFLLAEYDGDEDDPEKAPAILKAAVTKVPDIPNHKVHKEEGAIFHIFSELRNGQRFVFAVRMPGTHPVAGILEVRKVDPEAETLRIHHRFLPTAAARAVFADPSSARSLSNGVTVELMGVCDIPADGNVWWDAVGNPVEDVYWDGTGRTEPGDARQAVFRISSNETDPDLLPTIDLSVHRRSAPPGSWSGAFIVSKGNRTLENLRGCSFSLHDDHPTVDISATVGYGPWKTQASRSGSEASLRSTHTDIGTLLINAPTEKNGKATISATLLGQVEGARFVAVDKQGKAHPGETTTSIAMGNDSGDGPTKHQFLEAEFSLPLSQVDQFQFQTRAVKTFWFKNILLHPNTRTIFLTVIDRHREDDPYDGSTTLWAQQLVEAASKMSPEQVAGKLEDLMWLTVAAQVRSFQVLADHVGATSALVVTDLKSRDKAAVERACRVIVALDLNAFTSEIKVIAAEDEDLAIHANYAPVKLKAEAAWGEPVDGVRMRVQQDKFHQGCVNIMTEMLEACAIRAGLSGQELDAAKGLVGEVSASCKVDA